MDSGETEKALSAAHAVEGIGRQLYKSNLNIDIMVGNAIEAIGTERAQAIYQLFSNHSGLEELRFISMRNHLWRQAMRQDIDVQMPLLVGYMAVWSVFLILTFALFSTIFGFISSMIFYGISRKKIKGSLALSPVRKKTYLFIGLSWLFSLFMGALLIHMFDSSFMIMNQAVLSGAIILYLFLLYLLTGLSARGEGIYQGHSGPLPGKIPQRESQHTAKSCRRFVKSNKRGKDKRNRAG